MTTEPKHTPQEWLKEQCNRYVNGQCTIRGCLVRGGYVPGDKVDYSVATCEPHETLILLADNERLREALRDCLITAEAAVSAYEAKALKRDCFGTTRLNDFRTSLDNARAALSATEKTP